MKRFKRCIGILGCTVILAFAAILAAIVNIFDGNRAGDIIGMALDETHKLIDFWLGEENV